MSFRILVFGVAIVSTALRAAEPAEVVKRPAISGIANVVLYSHDLNLSRAYYRDYLGYAERASSESRLMYFNVSHRQQIELRAELTAGSDRLCRVGLITSDAEAMRRFLQARGHPVPAKLDRALSGDRSFTVSDPDGRVIEFIEHTPESPATATRGLTLPSTRIATRIRHAGFMVADLGASLKFYQDLLGFSETWRGSADDKILSWVNLKVPDGDEYLELMLYDPANPPDADRRGVLNHICLEVSDLVATEKIMRTRVLPTACKATAAMKTGRNGKRQINFYDPDGTRTEVMEATTVDGKSVPPSTAPPPHHKL